MRRTTGNMNGVQYCGNIQTNEVHDLDNETGNCQIDEILNAGHAFPFSSLADAHNAGYDNCHWCIGDSKH